MAKKDIIERFYSTDGKSNWHSDQTELDKYLKISRFNEISCKVKEWTEPLLIPSTNSITTYNMNDNLQLEYSHEKYFNWHKTLNPVDRYVRVNMFTSVSKDELKHIGPMSIKNTFDHSKKIEEHIQFSHDPVNDWHDKMTATDNYVKVVHKGFDTNGEVLTTESDIIRFNSSSFVNGDFNQYQFSVNGVDSWHDFYFKGTDNFMRIKHCPQKACIHSMWSNPIRLSANPYGIKDPSESEIRNITEIGLEPFKRKPYDLNKFSAQNLRMYSKELTTSDQPLSVYIRGLITTDNGDKTVSVTPGICFVNDSIVMLRKNIILTVPTLTENSEHYLVMEYRFQEDWLTPVPDFRFIRKVDLNPTIHAYFAEFDKFGQLVVWKESDRKKIQRETYGFLREVFTDNNYYPGSEFPVSGAAVKDMIDNVKFLETVYGFIDRDQNKQTSLYLIGNGGVQQSPLISTDPKDIASTFRKMVSDKTKWRHYSENIHNLDLIYEDKLSGLSGTLVGSGPGDMTHITLGRTKLDGIDTNIIADVSDKDNGVRVIIKDKYGVFDDVASTDCDALKRYLKSRHISDHEFPKYSMNYWKFGKELEYIRVSGGCERMVDSYDPNKYIHIPEAKKSSEHIVAMADIVNGYWRMMFRHDGTSVEQSMLKGPTHSKVTAVTKDTPAYVVVNDSKIHSDMVLQEGYDLKEIDIKDNIDMYTKNMDSDIKSRLSFSFITDKYLFFARFDRNKTWVVKKVSVGGTYVSPSKPDPSKPDPVIYKPKRLTSTLKAQQNITLTKTNSPQTWKEVVGYSSVKRVIIPVYMYVELVKEFKNLKNPDLIYINIENFAKLGGTYPHSTKNYAVDYNYQTPGYSKFIYESYTRDLKTSGNTTTLTVKVKYRVKEIHEEGDFLSGGSNSLFLPTDYNGIRIAANNMINGGMWTDNIGAMMTFRVDQYRNRPTYRNHTDNAPNIKFTILYDG